VTLAVIVGVIAMLLYAGQFVLSRWSIHRTLSLWDLAALRFATADRQRSWSRTTL
jgi:hypothetical protein